MGPSHARLCIHPSVPYALSWGRSIVAAGNDAQVIFYDIDGGMERTFDYSREPKCKVGGRLPRSFFAALS